MEDEIGTELAVVKTQGPCDAQETESEIPSVFSADNVTESQEDEICIVDKSSGGGSIE